MAALQIYAIATTNFSSLDIRLYNIQTLSNSQFTAFYLSSSIINTCWLSKHEAYVTSNLENWDWVQIITMLAARMWAFYNNNKVGFIYVAWMNLWIYAWIKLENLKIYSLQIKCNPYTPATSIILMTNYSIFV